MLTSEFDGLQTEVKEIKRQIRKIKKQQKVVDAGVEADPTSTLEKECRELASNSISLFGTVNLLLRKLFSVEEILVHSVSGKAGNSKIAAKPKFDSVCLDMLRKIPADIHGIEIANQTAITVKIQSVQKAVDGRSLILKHTI